MVNIYDESLPIVMVGNPSIFAGFSGLPASHAAGGQPGLTA
jgi:hypothetical protein